MLVYMLCDVQLTGISGTGWLSHLCRQGWIPSAAVSEGIVGSEEPQEHYKQLQHFKLYILPIKKCHTNWRHPCEVLLTRGSASKKVLELTSQPF